jgi:hypothetical protein
MSDGALSRRFLRARRSEILRAAHVRRLSQFERERTMAKQFWGGFFLTLVFVAVVLTALFGIFTLVSYLAGPVGG